VQCHFGFRIGAGRLLLPDAAAFQQRVPDPVPDAGTPFDWISQADRSGIMAQTPQDI
jgi:hypothetical protein